MEKSLDRKKNNREICIFFSRLFLPAFITPSGPLHRFTGNPINIFTVSDTKNKTYPAVDIYFFLAPFLPVFNAQCSGNAKRIRSKNLLEYPLQQSSIRIRSIYLYCEIQVITEELLLARRKMQCFSLDNSVRYYPSIAISFF